MTTARIAIIIFGLVTFGFIVGVIVGAILSGGLDDKLEERKKKKIRGCWNING